MPLWKALDQANAAPKFAGGIAKDKAYAQTVAVGVTGTFTNTSANVTAISNMTGISVNQLVSSNNNTIANGFFNFGGNSTTNGTSGVMTSMIVTAVYPSLNTVTLSGVYSGPTTATANVTFKNGVARGSTLYGNVTPNAFQNGIAVGVFGVGNFANASVITGNTILGSNVITNPVGAAFGNTQTGVTLTNNSNIMTVLNTTPLFVPMSIYSNVVGFANGVAIASVINSTSVQMSQTYTGTTNTTAVVTFSNIAIGMVASGNNLPPNSAQTNFLATISNGTVGQSGNTLVVTSMLSGPILQIGDVLGGNVSTANVYITSFGSAGPAGPATVGFSKGTGGVGIYGLSANLAVNAAAGAVATVITLVPNVAFVNSTAIQLNVNAIGSATGNTIAFSSYEKSKAPSGFSAGWVEVRYGTGPVTGGTTNATSTTNFANGETIVVSGGSGNALLSVVTNSTGNLAGVTVLTPGYGFTNVGNTVQTFSRQIHLANVTATGTPTAYVAGDKVTVTATFPLANCTGTIVNGVLNASNVAGTLTIGNLITGTGILPNTQILQQISGATAGGNGTYMVSTTYNAGNGTVNSAGQIVAGVANIASTAVANGVITLTNVGLFTSGLSVANLIFTYTAANGAAGTGSGITFSGSFATVSANGATAVTPILGGKAGRTYYETLVALQMKSDNPSDSGTFPNS